MHEQDTVDDHLAAEALVRQVGVELGGEGEDHDVGEHGAVERREHRDAEPGTDRREARVDQVPEEQHEADQRADQPEGREQLPERDEHVPRGLSLGCSPACVGKQDIGELVLVLALERERDALAHERIGFRGRRPFQGWRTARAVNAGQLLERRDHLHRTGVVVESSGHVAPRAREPGTREGDARHRERPPDGDEQRDGVHEPRRHGNHRYRRGQHEADPDTPRPPGRPQHRTCAHGPESRSGASRRGPRTGGKTPARCFPVDRLTT